MFRSRQTILIIGDLVTFGLVTVVGFISHGSLGSAGVRFWATYLPLVLAWLVLAAVMGLFVERLEFNLILIRQLTIAVIYSVSLASILRSLWLGGMVAPTFALVMIAVSLLGILAWRLVWQRIILKR